MLPFHPLCGVTVNPLPLMSYISPEVRLEALTVTVAVGLASPCVQDSVSVEGETFSVGLAVGSVMVPSIDLQHEHLRYYRSKQYDISRNSTLFNCQLSVLYSNNDSTASRSFNGTLSSSAQQPSLVQLLGVHDDSNPLQVSDGNPNIKNAAPEFM